jgi:uncharacterized OB-fold protein
MHSSTTSNPAGTGVLARHQAALDAGRFLIQRCGACQRAVYFPRALCPHCGAEEPALVTPAGTGAVYAVTTVRRKPEAGGDYNVCIVELDEGVRLMSRVEGMPPADVRIGLRVRARVVVPPGGCGMVVFDPMQGDPA